MLIAVKQFGFDCTRKCYKTQDLAHKAKSVF
jgi:hypothetical protein